MLLTLYLDQSKDISSKMPLKFAGFNKKVKF